MLLLWIALCFTWPGALGFTVRSTKAGLCLEDSSAGEVHLKACSLHSELQQWTWTGHGLLVNTGTSRCLSSTHSDSVRTVSCDSGEHIRWQCEAQQIVSLKTSLVLSAEGDTLSLNAGQHMWTSLDAGDICQDRPRSRRQRDADFEDDFEAEEHRKAVAHMKFLQWYYRTEDPTSWKFAMLGFAFVGLLIGCVLMVMGMMGNRSRKQIAKYRASTKESAVKAETEELQVIITEKLTEVKEEKSSSTPLMQNSHSDSANSKASEELKPGEIIVTWKDGNVSTLYPEPNGEVEEEVQSLDINISHEGQDAETCCPNTP